MSQKASMFVTVLISVAIAVPVALLLKGSPDVVATEAPKTVVDQERLAQLEQRVHDLAERGETLRVPMATGTTSDPGGKSHGEADRIAALERRVAALEKLRRGNSPVEVSRAPAPATDANREAQLRLVREQGKRKILDPKLSDKAKVEAHEALRQVPDAYTPAMVQELVRIGTSHQDPKLRSDVWRFFDGRSHIPSLVPPLLRALVYDPVDEVRDEASETLGNYLTDPAVLPALRHAAEHDMSMRVRRKAIRTLRQNRLADTKGK